MTLNSSGQISLGGTTVGQSISWEVGSKIGTQAVNSINDSRYRALAGIASGPISFSDFYSKSNPYWLLNINLNSELTSSTSYWSSTRNSSNNDIWMIVHDELITFGVTSNFIKINAAGNIELHKKDYRPYPTNFSQSPILTYSKIYSDNNQGIFITGWMTTSISNSDGVLARLDQTGAIVWQKALGYTNGGATGAFGVVADGTYIYTLWRTNCQSWGYFDYFITKHDYNGNELFRQAVGTANDEGYYGGNFPRIITFSAGSSPNLLFVGTRNDYPTNAPPKPVAYMYSTNGALLYCKTYTIPGDTSGGDGSSIVAAGTSTIYMTIMKNYQSGVLGQFHLLSLNGVLGIQWSRVITGTAPNNYEFGRGHPVIQPGTGHVYFTSSARQSSTAEHGIIGAFDLNGNLLFLYKLSINATYEMNIHFIDQNNMYICARRAAYIPETYVIKTKTGQLKDSLGRIFTVSAMDPADYSVSSGAWVATSASPSGGTPNLLYYANPGMSYSNATPALSELSGFPPVE